MSWVETWTWINCALAVAFALKTMHYALQARAARKRADAAVAKLESLRRGDDR